MQQVAELSVAMILCSYCMSCAGQVQSVDCDQMPCKNGGTCSPLSVLEGSQTIDSFSCQCPSETLQPLCDFRNNSPCNQVNPCMNGGTCLNMGSNQCSCNPGSVLPFCSHDCRDTPCQNGGTCTHHGLCLCPVGFSGTMCEAVAAVIRFTSSSDQVTENVGTVVAEVCFSNVASLSSNITFTLVTTPLSNNNYQVPSSGIITAGDMCTNILISITNDILGEPNGHVFVVTLTSVTVGGATIDPNFNTFTVTVVDDDLVNVQFQQNQYTVSSAEDVLTVTACFVPMTALSIPVTFLVQYLSTFQVGTIPIGAICDDITIPIASESPPITSSFDIQVTLVNGVLIPQPSTATIVVTDPADPGMLPVVTVCPPTFTEYSNSPLPQPVMFPQYEAIDSSGMLLTSTQTNPAVNLFTPSSPPQPQIVTFTFTDGAGQSATCMIQLIFILDQTPPTFVTCPVGTVSATLPSGMSTVSVPAVQMILALDDSSLDPTVTTVPADITMFSFGATPVTITAIDVAGNVAQCSFNVDVNSMPCDPNPCPSPLTEVCTSVLPSNTFTCAADVEPPVLIGCDNSTVMATPLPEQSTVVVTNLPVITATDNLDENIEVTSTVPVGNIFSTGTNPVTITFTDDALNVAACMFNVVVADTVRPVFGNCPDTVVMAALPFDQDTVTVLVEYNVTDNFDSNPVVGSVNNAFAAGITEVNVTATDSSNNIAFCSYTVEVTPSVAASPRPSEPPVTGIGATVGVIVLVVFVILLLLVVLVLVMRHRRQRKSKDKKTSKTNNGEGTDYVNAAVADDPEDYIPLETQSRSTSSSKYEDLRLKPQSNVPVQCETTIVPEPQNPETALRIQTRNMGGVRSGSYEDVDAISEKKQLPDETQSHPSGDEDEDTGYEVPDRLEEYTGVYVNVQNKNLVRPKPIDVAKFQMFMTRNKEDVVRDIVHQFMVLPSGGQYPWNVALKFQNRPRNFYKTLLPYDHSRVKLDTAGSDAMSDYINANYIKNHQGKISFIAAQGPRDITADDFWRMVWQENVEIIVMVTDNFEKNKLLCCTYWPSKVHTGEVYGDITVILMESTSYTTHTTRKLNLLKGNHKAEVHTVTQIQVHSWPYGGVLKETTSLISIIKKLKTEHSDGISSPLLIHCSNGVGATGTFIAAYALMDIINKNKHVSVFDFVKQMRVDRIDMVQTRIQYLFIFEFLLAVLQSTDSQMSCDQLKKLGRVAIKQKCENEFKVLQKSVVTEQHNRDCDGNSPENQYKNRFNNLIPEDKFRPVLKSQGNTYGSNIYINAFHVADFGGREFIMTQTPLASTVEDFWRLVFDYECTTVVMLNTIGGSDKTVVQYWPSGGAQYGLITVECLNSTKSDSWIQSQFQVAHRLVEEKSVLVNHFAFCGWSGYESDVSKLGKFIRYTGSKSSGPVLVHCINGVGLSAVYVIAKTESDKMEQEGFVDVFQSLKKLRKNCPLAIQKQEEYALCYQLLKDHLDNPEEYSVVY